MPHLFTYGTLMFPEIWQRVVGVAFRHRAAVVDGFGVWRVRGQWYPVMLPAEATARVEGIVYFDLDQPTLDLLDQYESHHYLRQEIQVRLSEDSGQRRAAGELPGSSTLACEAYVLRAEYRDVATREAWSRDWFQQHGLQRYLADL
jgi:gamma-glutamylcyclotransferase (GGCT)/AIG2-like uncharacterized protein YtfP